MGITQLEVARMSEFMDALLDALKDAHICVAGVYQLNDALDAAKYNVLAANLKAAFKPLIKLCDISIASVKRADEAQNKAIAIHTICKAGRAKNAV